jgi:hypothetical protein
MAEVTQPTTQAAPASPTVVLAQAAQAPDARTPTPRTDAEKAYAWKLLQAALANSRGTATLEQQELFAIIQERQDGQLTARANQARDYARWANANLEEAGAAALREAQRELKESNERLQRELSGTRPRGISYVPGDDQPIRVPLVIAGLQQRGLVMAC